MTTANTNSVTRIDVAKDTTSGYNLLFAPEVILYPTGKNISVDLKQKPDASGKITITDFNNKMYVDVGGEHRTVNIPQGTYTPEELIQKLNESELKGEVKEMVRHRL